MARYFNITGLCKPKEHYMVNLDGRIAEVRKYIEAGNYFTINRGRQYGKTTFLRALEYALEEDYIVVSMDFQFLGTEDFATIGAFVKAFARHLWSIKKCRSYMSEDIVSEIKTLKQSKEFHLGDLFSVLSDWCDEADKPIVLLIDEVDSASNNQVFLDFLAQLRGYYLKRDEFATFRSVILAGVHDIRNLRQKIRPDSEHKHNSPWNIATSFDVEMKFSPSDIRGMLKEYEEDHHTGMDISGVAQWIYDFTSGYPVLVSWICKLIDESEFSWNEQGVVEAVKELQMKQCPLFDSLINKLEDNEELRNTIYAILFQGENVLYSLRNDAIANAAMYGFVKKQNSFAVIANRIFETILYEWFIETEKTRQRLSILSADEKNQFITDGHLNMELVLEKFVVHFNDLYKDSPEKFLETDGRKLFLLYLRPIINGVGNYYMESLTRDLRRTDIIVDYLGEQFVIEMKIWHGEEYNKRGEQQLKEYLDYYHIDKGYMVSFNFNQNKLSGVHTVTVGDKVIVEAVV